MSAPSNGYVYVKTWVLNNSKVYSFLLAPPIYYFLYAYVCPFQIRTHTYCIKCILWRWKGNETDGKDYTKCYSHTQQQHSIHLAFSYCRRQHATRDYVRRVQQLLFSFFFSILITCASSLYFLNFVPLVSLKSTAPAMSVRNNDIP